MFDRHPRRLCLNGLRLDALAEWPSDVAPEARMAQARARRFCRLAALQPDGPHDGGRRGASYIALTAPRRYAQARAIERSAVRECGAGNERLFPKGVCRNRGALAVGHAPSANRASICAVRTGHVKWKHVQAANRQLTRALDQGWRRADATGAPNRAAVTNGVISSAHGRRRMRIRRGRRCACRWTLPCRSILNCKFPHANMARQLCRAALSASAHAATHAQPWGRRRRPDLPDTRFRPEA